MGHSDLIVIAYFYMINNIELELGLEEGGGGGAEEN